MKLATGWVGVVGTRTVGVVYVNFLDPRLSFNVWKALYILRH